MRILYGTDGSSAARGALDQLLATFALPPGTTAEVMAVEPTGLDSGVGADRIAATNIEVAVRRFEESGIPASGRVAAGDPAIELIARAVASSPDLVVLGADLSRPGDSHLLAGSIGRVAETVTLDGHASVLICAGGQAIRRVLIASDGSPEAQRAMALLDQLPFQAPPEIVVVTVAEPAGAVASPGLEQDGPWTHLQHEADDVARAIATEAAGRLRARALRIDIRTPAGRPAELLPILAAEVSADLIVVGTRGLGARQRRRLGSVTESLMQRMPASLLVVRAVWEPVEP